MDAFKVNKPLIKVAEDAISYAFQAGYEEANEGLKKSPFYFVETILIGTVHWGTLDDMFKRSTKKWTKIFTFMDTFI